MSTRKAYRIHISSTNVMPGGTWQNGIYQVSLAVDSVSADDYYQVTVERWICNTSFTTVMCICPSLDLKDTMTTTLTKGGNANILFMTVGNSYEKVTEYGTVGFPLGPNPNFFRNVQLNIQLTDSTGAALTAMLMNHQSGVLFS